MVPFNSNHLWKSCLITITVILHIVNGHGSRFYFRPLPFFRPYPTAYQKTTPDAILRAGVKSTATPVSVPSNISSDEPILTFMEDVDDGSGEINPVDQQELKINHPTSSDLSSSASQNENDDTDDSRKFSCSGRHQGYYADVRSNCQKYFRCVFDKQQTLWCPPKMRFDQSLFVCVRAERALPCHKSPHYFSLNRQRFLQDSLLIDHNAELGSQRFSCVGKKYGHYPDERSKCRMFFECSPDNVDGQARVVIICPEGFVFDKRQNKCVPHYARFICTS